MCKQSAAVQLREVAARPRPTSGRRAPPRACTAQGQDEVKYFLHNHLRFNILYHKDAETDLARIVGFEVEPFSVKHEYEKPYDKQSPVLNTCNPGRAVKVTHNQPPQPVQDGVEVIFTYDVMFAVSMPWGRRFAAAGQSAPASAEGHPCHSGGRAARAGEKSAPGAGPWRAAGACSLRVCTRQVSEIRWASRWDTYLLMMDDQIHWFSIINSVMIVLFLSGMVAVIIIRVLRRDITNYNQLESGEDAQEETGWKLVRAGWGKGAQQQQQAATCATRGDLRSPRWHRGG